MKKTLVFIGVLVLITAALAPTSSAINTRAEAKSDVIMMQTPVVAKPTAGITEEVSEHNCNRILGTGSLRIVIVPAGFDGDNPKDVSHFKLLSLMIAEGFRNTEPYRSHKDKFSIYRLDDYRGKDIKPTEEELWYNMDLINAASSCKYDEILVVANNSSLDAGSPAGFYSVVFSGTPLSCDPTTCTGTACPGWSPTCSNDYGVSAAALHEMGHTLAGLSHIEDPKFCATETDTIMCPNLMVPLPKEFTVVEQKTILSVLLDP